MKIQVGDFVRAQQVIDIPLREVDIDLHVEGKVLEFKEGDSQVVVQTPSGNQITCYATCAEVLIPAPSM